MSDIKEFEVDSYKYFSKSMNEFKEFLKANKKIKIVGTTNSANQASHLAEALRRLGYIEFDDIKTETLVKNDTRYVRLVITVHTSPDFDKLYQEHEAERKKREEERKKMEEDKKKGKDDKKQ